MIFVSRFSKAVSRVYDNLRKTSKQAVNQEIHFFKATNLWQVLEFVL